MEIQVPVSLWDRVVSTLLKCHIPDMNFGNQGTLLAEIMQVAQKHKEQSAPKEEAPVAKEPEVVT